MSALVELRAAAKKLGARIERERNGDWSDLRVSAPEFHVWTATGTHERVAHLRVSIDLRPGEDDAETLAALVLDDVRAGVEPCFDGDDCEWCHPTSGGGE